MVNWTFNKPPKIFRPLTGFVDSTIHCNSEQQIKCTDVLAGIPTLKGFNPVQRKRVAFV